MKVLDDIELLQSQVSTLNTDRGYLNTIRLADNTDFNTVTANGKYKIVYDSGAGINSPNDSYFGSYSLDVTENGESGYVYQKATCFCSTGDLLGKTFERYQINGVWQGWQQITIKLEKGFFISDETILSFANSCTTYSTKEIVAGHGSPSDNPLSGSEGIVEILVMDDIRKIVRYTIYGNAKVYLRCIFGQNWYLNWTNVLGEAI